MIASLFKDKVQLALLGGIGVSGLSLVIGLYGPDMKWLGLAAVLGPILATITVILYGGNLIKAISLNDTYGFWSDLCTLNLGLLLVQFVLFESKQPEVFLSVLLSASAIGLVLSLALYKFSGINSRLALILFHVLFLTPSTHGSFLVWELLLSGYLSTELVMPLTMAAVLILMPVFVHSIATAR